MKPSGLQSRVAAVLLAVAGAWSLGWMAAQTSRQPPARKNPAAEATRLNNLGVGYMNQQQFQKALEFFRQARAADPRLTSAYLNQGIALLNLQRLDPAEKVLTDVTRIAPRSARAWYNLGLLFKAQGDAQRALTAFQHAAELAPEDADALYFIGSLYAQQRQFPRAIESFRRALQSNPFHASAEFGLARALQQSGDTAEARRHLQRFQQITRAKLGAPLSVAYGEQGPLSTVESSTYEIQPVPAPIPVKFVVTDAGLAQPPPLTTAAANLAASAGPGACVFDYDGDGRPDLFLPAAGKQGGMALYHNLGSHFEDVTAAAGFDPSVAAVSCAAGDYDNDGFADLAVGSASAVKLFHNQKNGTFRDVTQASAIHMAGVALGMTFIDYDHDGDLDLYVTRAPDLPLVDLLRSPSIASKPGNILWRNNGNGSFTDVTADAGLAGPAPGVGAIGSDFNNDRAVDFLITSFGAAPQIFSNPREGKFPVLQPWPAGLAAVGAAVFDFNKDGRMDVAFTHADASALSLWRNVDGSHFEQVKLPVPAWQRAWGLTPVDYDDDGWIDLAAVGETAGGKGEIRLFRNLGAHGFQDVSPELGLDKISVKAPRALVAADFTASGAPDLLVTQNGGPPLLLRNQGGNRHNWLRVALRGLADNKSSFGTKVEVFAGAMRQKFEVAGSSGYLGQNPPDVLAGLADEKSADVVRLLWPTGVLQDEIQVAADRRQPIGEIDRRGSSCPALFAWDGRHYQFIADMTGAGVVGHWVAPGERNIPRPVEYVKVEGPSLSPRDGKLSFRFMEPMEEVVYLDQLQLLAIDHPRDTQVFPNEYFASNPPYPAFKVISSHDPRPPAGAWDDSGRNVLPELLHRDRKYVTGFELLSFAGFARPHTLELDLGAPYSAGPLRLLMTGYVDYFSASSMYAAGQAGIRVTAPSVDALAPSGKWVRVLDDMGFPAGLPRTITVDLTGRLPAGARRIRMSTNLQIYWDQVLIDRTPEAPVRRSEVRIASAALRFHGYPRQVPLSLPGDITFLYDDSSRTGPYTHEAGSYTRYGDVLPLVEGADDKLVVFGSGEEIAIDFDPARLPPLPSGWLRDYFFMARGYEKDMDFYAADANTVDPMPFGAMPRYPYPPTLTFPDDAEHVAYRLEYNTRYLSGRDPQSFRFVFDHDHPVTPR